MKIKLLTAYFGGPYQWGVDLADGLRGYGFDVVHTHNRLGVLQDMVYEPSGLIHTTIPLPVRLQHKPMVATIKGDYTREKNILQRFYPRLVAQADVVTTPSQFMKEKIGVEAAVIPNAVVPSRWRIAPHGTRDRLNIATIMNFYFQGKAEGAVKMLELMGKASVDNLRHIVVGDGPYCQGVKDVAKDSGMDVRFSGLVYDPGVVLSNSDLFLYYSYHDNFPNVILEAMAAGLPVLSNNVGALPEMIENGVDGFVAEDEEEYVVYLRRLMEDADLRQSIGVRARQSVERKFNWELLIPRYIEIYEGLC